MRRCHKSYPMATEITKTAEIKLSTSVLITGRHSCRVRHIIKLLFLIIGSSKFGWLLYQN